MKRSIPLAILSAALLAATTPALAQSAKGTVKKVDLGARKITLDHAAIPKLDMDAMIMVYKVNDPAMLKGLQTGDKVDFEVDQVDGQYTVTRIEKAK